jgi:PleD family two-component response regulator
MKIPHEQNTTWGIVTTSIGASRLEKAEGPVKALFRDADAALFRAKDAGRNRVEFS